MIHQILNSKDNQRLVGNMYLLLSLAGNLAFAKAKTANNTNFIVELMFISENNHSFIHYIELMSIEFTFDMVMSFR